MITKREISADFKENGLDKDYDTIFSLICQNIRIETASSNRFVYFIDEKYVYDSTKGYRYENLTPDYQKVLEHGLIQMKYQDETNKFCTSYNHVLDALVVLADRVIEYLKNHEATEEKIQWFADLKNQPAKGFEEAIQRMLFVNQIFWQMDHRLTGLGAWDKFLVPYYKSDLEKGRITKEEALIILKDLYTTLHFYFEYKSNILMGDTGQIFVLGSSNLEGNYICNELTYLFIEAMKEVQLPEPKCLLRVNQHTPRDLIELSLESIATGLGAPLLANDDVIIPCLIEFGIEPEDACMYTTSACWEPLIGGKSTSLNNMTVLNYLKAFDNLIKRSDLAQIHSFEELLELYLIFLKRNIRAVKRVLEPFRFQYNPLLSVFTKGCFESRKDVSEGGAKYHHVGITSVAMGNLLDTLFNVKELVFDKKDYQLLDVKKVMVGNYAGYEELQSLLKQKRKIYGLDEEEVLQLVNRIMDCVSEEIKDYRNYLGGKMKIGLSGSAYMDAARNFGASFDGRRAGEPFVVHISNEDSGSFTEIVRFASQLDYRNRQFNGNVVDFMVSPDFIYQNWDKFVDFLMGCIRSGFFEMQMNVVSSKILLAARNEPEKFPNLIVRVWGFSAYFKDLPEEYKDVLIERALRNEGIGS